MVIIVWLVVRFWPRAVVVKARRKMANLMNVAPKSVRMTRYRLKQKLGLSKDEDLASFLSAKLIAYIRAKMEKG